MKATQQSAEPPGESPGTGLRYSDYVHKVTRLPEQDLDALMLLARRLEKGRQASRPPGAKQPRITENTLIRLAVRLLLQQGGQLDGATEEELWDSLHP